MATATRNETVTVTLELDADEAQFIADVMSLVGGSNEGRRKHADSLLSALYSAGFDFKMGIDLGGHIRAGL